MLVKWNGMGLLGCPGVEGKMVTLKPGCNDVADADAAVMLANPGVAHRVEAGDLEFIAPMGKGKAAAKSGDVSEAVAALIGLKPGKAKKAAAETIDGALLLAWLELEEREDVKVAIEAQLGALSAPAEHREKAS